MAKIITPKISKEEISEAINSIEQAVETGVPQADKPEEPGDKSMHVFRGIVQVMDAMSKVGISKDRTASTGKSGSYKFRGIDDVYNALGSELAKAKICILPQVQSRDVVERKSASGNALFYVTLMVQFVVRSAVDDSWCQIVTMGEAMDSGDKATNKAMSAAYKYAALMAFCIPTEGDNDSENQTHEVRAMTPPDDAIISELNPHMVPVPLLMNGKGSDWMKWGHSLSLVLKGAGTIDELEAWVKFNAAPLDTASKDAPKIYKRLAEIAETRRAEIEAMMGAKGV